MKIRDLLLVLMLAGSAVMAQEPFVITDIRVEGLEKLDQGTVFNYLPLKVGDEVNEEETGLSIKELFKTGFFREVSLEQDGTTLVVKVVERPSIASIDIEGNDDLADEAIMQGLEQVGLVAGRIFQVAALEQVERDLLDAYLAQGRYSATVETEVEELERNRVALTININEGRVARIKKINIIGAEQISVADIKDEMKLRDRRGWGFARKDQYSKQKLEADLESIRSLYQNRGFHEFEIVSTSVDIGPNKQSIFISIVIHEGDTYVFGDSTIEGVEPDIIEELMPLVEIESGEAFSQQDVSATRKAIGEYFADQGYAFVEVRANFEKDEQSKTVATVFSVVRNQRVYVRRINISGNIYTRDQVIRRELRQFEGAWYSAGAVRRSKARLQRLGLFNTVTIETPQVAGTTDQVDMEVIVVERDTGSVLFSAGYSDDDGVLFGIEFEQRNLFGAGKDLSVAAKNADAVDSIVVSYTNPYHTPDGISRGIRYERTEVDSTEISTAEYALSEQFLSVFYKIPIAENNTFNLGLAYEGIELEALTETPPEIGEVIDKTPRADDYLMTMGLSRDTRDDFFFPNSGGSASATLELALPGSDFEYYKFNLIGSYYQRLSEKLTLKGGAGYGTGDNYGDSSSDLPFFKNFFAGGPSSVRGFESRSLGPRDTGSTPSPLGGDTRILVNLELLFAAFGDTARDKRFGLFIDGGQVWGPAESVDISDMRYTAGLFFNWYSPIGPFTISYSTPLEREPGDELEGVQISLGTVFR